MKNQKKLLVIVAIALVVCALSTNIAFAQEDSSNQAQTIAEAKALPSALAIGLAAAPAAIAMGLAIYKATDSISRQPEAEGSIRTTLMLGLVFIETLVIYALIVAILIIFVL